MAFFKANEADNYGGTGGTGFFGIANDKEQKSVRFLYNTIDDVQGMSVHRVKVGDKDRYVNCLRDYNSPVDDCPFCKAKYPVQARLFVPVYNIEEDAVQIWDRGKTMFSKMSALCSRYVTDGKALVNSIFDVQRNGKPHDMKTQYEIYYVKSDNTEIEDLPEYPDILGGLVLDKSFEDMQMYVQDGKFPDTPGNNNHVADEMPIRRRSAERRTPATSNQGDRF